MRPDAPVPRGRGAVPVTAVEARLERTWRERDARYRERSYRQAISPQMVEAVRDHRKREARAIGSARLANQASVWDVPRRLIK